MVISRVTRVSNPRTRRRATSKRRNPKRLSLKQKLHFGSARQRAAAKAALRKKRANPKRRKTVVTKRRHKATATKRRVAKVRRRRRVNNPAHLLTLGLVNPTKPKRRRKKATTKRRVKKSMARTKKRRSTRRRAASNPRRRRRNSVRVIVRRSNSRRRTRRHRANPRRHRRVARRRNPSLFGHSVSAAGMAKAVAGGLAGVAITKAVPNMLPAGLVGTSPLMNTLTSAVVAFAAGTLTKMIFKSDPTIGDAVMFGGFMQAGSVALNSFFPQVGTVIGLHGLGNGLGDLVPGRFPVPMNPITAGQPVALPAPAAPAGGMHGVGAIYSPFGRAM